ncbi:MAG TPA: hypothetical protein VFK43_14980 [Acidimicrobiales bacterium]|nr:hypothetical protein [Acidimicrobiales bacterium]
MAAKNPLGKIKDLTVDTLRSPKDLAGKAVGQARGAASAGRHLAGQATKSATSLTAGAVSKLMSGRKPTVAPAAEDLPTPVNVTEELGLDPAPVEAPATDEPLTSIDAEADVSNVDVTPADVAKAVAKKAPARKPAAPKAPAAKKAPARKSAPGAKLPPRKKVEQA